MGIFYKLRVKLIAVISLYVIFPNQSVLAYFVSPLKTKNGMVVSANPLASDAGLEILSKGGNAVDAAVATTFAISVVEPFSAGIGGGGFLLLHQAQTKEIRALDFRERAPLKATKNMYLDANGKVRPNASVDGHLAAATPGTVAGLYEVHRRYGKLSWQEVIKPAITLAKDGFILSPVVTYRSLQAFNSRKKTILSNPAAREIFTRNGEFYQPGEKLVQRDLARTLTLVAQNPENFYTGSIARAIADDMAKNGGLITLQDLKTYKPIWRNPVCGNFVQVNSSTANSSPTKICSMPPPSSGGVHLLQILNIISDINFKSLGWHNPDALHLMVEAMKIAYADRSQYLGDPDFVKVPVAQLISPEYAKLRRQQITMDRAKASSEVKPGDLTPLTPFPLREGEKFNSSVLKSYESTETSHLNVIDAQRNAVSLTFTVNLGFGAGVVAAGTGIVLNNEMDDFAIAPGVPNAFGLVGNEANAIAPRKTPLSSMTPTIVTENGRLRMVVGAPGGSTIITQVLQVILNVLQYNMNVGTAVSAPRIHHQWLPDQLRVDKFALDAMTLAELRRRGHNIKETEPWGNINAILVTPDNTLEGAADPRGEGAARGF
ncbi:MAG: gamma-glutamyltransferase [Scytonematopsis contorta HA4267-MV1]|jgi:gamma-glutamyltranspeptidase/glutathione hydrolase|nr:gamma-glutamyltransferase [Scytonematopsis contorta HA4267-MV1]